MPGDVDNHRLNAYPIRLTVAVGMTETTVAMKNLDISLLTQLWAVIRTIPGRLSHGHYFREASALSFSTVLALVPLKRRRAGH